MEKVFQALSSATRRKILAYLSEAHLNAGEISKRFNMSKPTISRHLDILENAGLITGEKQGSYIYYSIVKENLTHTLHDFLSDFCPVSRKYKKESKTLKRGRHGKE